MPLPNHVQYSRSQDNFSLQLVAYFWSFLMVFLKHYQKCAKVERETTYDFQHFSTWVLFAPKFITIIMAWWGLGAIYIPLIKYASRPFLRNKWFMLDEMTNGNTSISYYILFFLPNKCPDFCWHRLGSSCTKRKRITQ